MNVQKKESFNFASFARIPETVGLVDPEARFRIWASFQSPFFLHWSRTRPHLGADIEIVDGEIGGSDSDGELRIIALSDDLDYYVDPGK